MLMKYGMLQKNDARRNASDAWFHGGGHGIDSQFQAEAATPPRQSDPYSFHRMTIRLRSQDDIPRLE